MTHPSGLGEIPGYVKALDRLVGQSLRDATAQPRPTTGAPSLQTWTDADADVHSNLDAMAAAVTHHDRATFNTASAKIAQYTKAAYIAAHSDGIPQCG